MTAMQQATVAIRWMVSRDMPAVLRIERESFEYPWAYEDFIRVLRRRDCIGMVAERNGEVVGFVVCELTKTQIEVLNLAVAAAWRHQGIGSQILDYVKQKLWRPRRWVRAEVRETNLGAQLFFRANGFMAVNVLRDLWDDSDEDTYLMVYRRWEE